MRVRSMRVLQRLLSPLPSKPAASSMDEVVKKAMGAAQSKKRTSVPWNFDEPWKQPYYTYSNKWQPVDPSHTDIKQPSLSWLALYAWNIDFMLPFAESRMQLAIRHLEKLVNRLDERTARVIYLQECVESDLKLLAKDHGSSGASH